MTVSDFQDFPPSLQQALSERYSTPLRAVRLGGGTLNAVWRVYFAEHTAVVKQILGHAASAPEVLLDPGRLAVEAEAYRQFQRVGDVSVPRLLAELGEQRALVIEDAGALVDLRGWLQRAPLDEAAARAEHLGRFIARLHLSTAEDPRFRTAFDNVSIQRTRHDAQYRQAGAFAEALGVSAHAAVGEACNDLGERLCSLGSCVVMGDLWPASVLVGPETLTLIDWELAHYGQPLQDTAHLYAHLSMLESAFSWAAARAFRERFVASYQATAGKTDAFGVDAAAHFGAEILARAAGPFRDGGPFADLPLDDDRVRRLVSRAADLVASGKRLDDI